MSEEERDTWTVVRTSGEAREAILTGTVTEVSFDNDLGPGQMEGWKIMQEMIDLIIAGTIPKPEYIGIHTANIVAAKRMYEIRKDLNRWECLHLR